MQTASKAKYVRRGVKEVVKAVRKGATGLAFIAGDISPIDVISHLPIMFEDAGIPYIYVPSKSELGGASGTKRPTSVILVTVPDDFKYKDLYDTLHASVSKLAIVY